MKKNNNNKNQQSIKHQKWMGKNKHAIHKTAMRNDETVPTPKLPQKIKGKTGNSKNSKQWHVSMQLK